MRYLLLFIITLSASAQPESQPSVPVTTQPLTAVLIERRLTANAEVMSVNNTQLSSELTAVVSELHVDVGDEVKQGDLLLTMDVLDLNLQLDQAKANSQAAQARLQQAELRLKRANELKQSQYISADDLLGRETDVAVLRAELLRLKVAEKIATRQLDKAQITAPFDGVVTNRQAQQGQLLTLGSPIMHLVQLSDKQIHANIPNHLSRQLATADRIVFSQNNQEIPVELIQLSPVIEQQSSLQTARFKPLAEVLVGQTGQLVWYLKGQLLSADLVVKRAGQLGVFIVNDKQAKFMPLPNAQEGRPVPMSVTPDWQVIIGGRERLQDGQAIKLK
ncbi:efflux RND transporter periplasmic adaptor subunit [Marinicella litoralis]|uniref:RND family efflux transporter MFP subunit n=1 Tax=Marinicella litoralis TaxID=644220 RepID=A0A4R6XR63_9GAMM|nr:efflux RND transporter periplasmic adaptor subunit [Marinicella litoralis]TDR20367.1 RND family efflux transporter MFP subunit [Marinicella litoralis]